MKVELYRLIDLASAAGAKVFAEAVAKGFHFRSTKAAPARGESVQRRGRRRKKKRGIHRIPEDMGKKILRMRADGISPSEIARIHKISASGVRNYCCRAKKAMA